MSILVDFVLMLGFFAGCVTIAAHLSNSFRGGVWTTLVFLSSMEIGHGIGEARLPK